MTNEQMETLILDVLHELDAQQYNSARDMLLVARFRLQAEMANEKHRTTSA